MALSPLPVALNDANFLKRLRAVAADSGRVVLVSHAARRMKQRKITLAQVIACLQKGTLREPAHLTPYGDWKATIGYRSAGDEVQVAVVLERDNDGDWCVVVTVMH